jgi:hypothetical protein
VAQLVEAPRYKPEGRGFDSRLCHWNSSLTQSFRPHYGPGVDSASNRDGFGGLVVSMLASGSRVHGFEPDRGRWIFSDVKKSSACLPSEGK